MLGCTPKGRHTEQHDIFFGIGGAIKDLKQDIIDFWPEAKGKIHLDAFREVTNVDGYEITVVPADEAVESPFKLFFLNLGGYKEDQFEELHYKVLTVSDTKAGAIKQAKQTAFYKHCGFKGATSHIDDKYGVDVDDIYEIGDILPAGLKSNYKLQISPAEGLPMDKIHLGYFILNKLDDL